MAGAAHPKVLVRIYRRSAGPELWNAHTQGAEQEDPIKEDRLPVLLDAQILLAYVAVVQYLRATN